MTLAPNLNRLMVFKLGFGLDGAAFSIVIICVLLVLVILRYRKQADRNPGPNVA